MSVLNLPPPSWMTEDLVLLEEQARRFIATEYVPHLDTWNEQGMYGREVWTKARLGWPPLSGHSRRVRRGRRQFCARSSDRPGTESCGIRFVRGAAALRYRRALHSPLRDRRTKTSLAAKDRYRRTFLP